MFLIFWMIGILQYLFLVGKIIFDAFKGYPVLGCGVVLAAAAFTASLVLMRRYRSKKRTSKRKPLPPLWWIIPSLITAALFLNIAVSFFGIRPLGVIPSPSSSLFSEAVGFVFVYTVLACPAVWAVSFGIHLLWRWARGN